MNSDTNISYLLSGPAFQEFMRRAQRSRNFESMPAAKRQKMNPFASKVSNNHKKIINNAKSHKTPPQSPVGGVRNLPLTTTPGGSKVVGKYRVPPSGSPIRNISSISRQSSYPPPPIPASPPRAVRATGPEKLNKGDLVIPRSQVAMVRRALRMYKNRNI